MVLLAVYETGQVAVLYNLPPCAVGLRKNNIFVSIATSRANKLNYLCVHKRNAYPVIRKKHSATSTKIIRFLIYKRKYTK